MPSLAGLSFPAGRFEREIRDLFGIIPDGHPMPSRLVRHFHWPRGWHPMRHGAGDPPPFGDVDGPFQFRTVEGPGVYEIPVGPVHAGMIEPGSFPVLRRRRDHPEPEGPAVVRAPRHRETLRGPHPRRRARTGRTGQRRHLRRSRAGVLPGRRGRLRRADPPLPPNSIRAILLELERLYNHVNDIGALCNDVGHGILNNQAQRVREQLLRINDQVTGHRLLRGAIRIGGAEVIALPDPDALAAIAADAAEIVALALAHSVVRDRFTGTAVLTRQQALDLGTLGYVARASGVPVDARHDHPVHGVNYPHPTPAHTDGDVLSRFLIRAEEITASVQTITTLMQPTSTSA